MRPHASLALAVVLAACAMAVSAAAPITQWKWRDANGRMVWSDLAPPPSVPDSAILERPTDAAQYGRRAAPKKPEAAAAQGDGAAKPVATSAPRATQPAVDPELEARRRRAAEEQTAQQRAQGEQDRAVRAENCARARSHLNALAEGQRIARTNERGEREVLDDKGRADEMQRARQIIASDCR